MLARGILHDDTKFRKTFAFDPVGSTVFGHCEFLQFFVSNTGASLLEYGGASVSSTEMFVALHSWFNLTCTCDSGLGVFNTDTR